MDFEYYNKKRMKTNIISITITILIVALYVLFIIFLSSIFILSPLFGAIVMLALLYLLSKFYVMNEYYKLKTNFIFETIKDKINANKIIISKEKNDFLYHFFDKNKLNIKSNYIVESNELTFNLTEFESYEKRFIKSNVIVFAGKLMSFDIKSDLNFALVLNNNQLTDKFCEYFTYYFKKKDDNFFAGKRKYTLLFDKFSNDINLSFLNELKDFNCLYVNNEKLYLLYLDKTPIFDFKLQNKIDYKMKNYCLNCYESTIRILNKLRNEATKCIKKF